MTLKLILALLCLANLHIFVTSSSCDDCCIKGMCSEVQPTNSSMICCGKDILDAYFCCKNDTNIVCGPLMLHGVCLSKEVPRSETAIGWIISVVIISTVFLCLFTACLYEKCRSSSNPVFLDDEMALNQPFHPASSYTETGNPFRDQRYGSTTSSS